MNKALMSLKHRLENHRVDLFVDNQAVISSWEKGGGKCSDLNSVLKSIFRVCQTGNIDLHMFYINTKLNPADFESRVVNLSDSTLSANTWRVVESKFGPHTIDLMATDSNAMHDQKGSPLPHFTPTYTPSSAGINVFAQNIAAETNPYVFPPFCLVSAVLNFLMEQKPVCVTFVFPEFPPLPHWWPKLWSVITDFVVLGNVGDESVLLRPSKNGYQPFPLSYKLYAAKIIF